MVFPVYSLRVLFCKQVSRIQVYIKTNVFDAILSDIIHAQSEYRTSSDYDDFFVISKAEVAEQIENAELFLSAITNYLQGIYCSTH